MKAKNTFRRVLVPALAILMAMCMVLGLVACNAGQAQAIEYIVLNTDSVQKTFEVNDEFTYDGLVVTAHYSDGATEEVTNYSVKTPDMSTAGAKDVVVKYGNTKSQYAITVNSDNATGESYEIGAPVVKYVYDSAAVKVSGNTEVDGNDLIFTATAADGYSVAKVTAKVDGKEVAVKAVNDAYVVSAEALTGNTVVTIAAATDDVDNAAYVVNYYNKSNDLLAVYGYNSAAEELYQPEANYYNFEGWLDAEGNPVASLSDVEEGEINLYSVMTIDETAAQSAISVHLYVKDTTVTAKLAIPQALVEEYVENGDTLPAIGLVLTNVKEVEYTVSTSDISGLTETTKEGDSYKLGERKEIELNDNAYLYAYGWGNYYGTLTVTYNLNTLASRYFTPWMLVNEDTLVYGASDIIPAKSQEATIAYTAGSTTNMTGNNDAATLGVDPSIFNVWSEKNNSGSDHVGLNQNNFMRLYYNQRAILHIDIDGLYEIESIKVNLYSKSEAALSDLNVVANGQEVTGDNGVYAIDGTSVSLSNAQTANKKLDIASIVVTYKQVAEIDPMIRIAAALAAVEDTIDLTGETYKLPQSQLEDVEFAWTVNEGAEVEVEIDQNGMLTVKELPAVATAIYITVTATHNDSGKSDTKTVKVNIPAKPADDEIRGEINITRNSFSSSITGYNKYSWSAEDVNGTIGGNGYIYGSENGKLQFNGNQSGAYIASNIETPAPITKITVTTASGTERSWKLYTSDAPYEGSYKFNSWPAGTDQGAQTVTTSGTTWTIEEGEYYYFALVLNISSGASYIQSIVVEYAGKPKAPCTHENTIVSVPQQAATCTEDGYEAHYACTNCGKTFSDELGQNECEPTVINALEHKYTYDDNNDGLTHTATCERNDSVIADEKHENNGDGTCTKCGGTIGGEEPSQEIKLVFNFNQAISSASTSAYNVSSLQTVFNNAKDSDASNSTATCTVTATSYVYAGESGYSTNSLKFSSSSYAGTMTLDFGTAKVKAVIINAFDRGDSGKIVVNNGVGQTPPTSAGDLTFELTTSSSTVTIAASAKKQRFFINSITFIFE